MTTKLFAKPLAFAAVAVLPVFMASCTAVDVKPIDPKHKISSVVIRQNPKVIVKDFLPTLQEGFRRNGISTKVVAENADTTGSYAVDYVAYQTWDLVTFMREAHVNVRKDGLNLGEANFHMRNGGGYALTKFKSVRSKMDPLLDRMLAGVRR
jgi:hypothetical protein